MPASPPSHLHSTVRPDDTDLLTATFPADKAGAYTLRISPATAADAGAAVRVSTTTFRVEPPRREVDEPSLNRPLLNDIARVTKGRVFDFATVDQLDDAIAMREVTQTLEDREELWDAAAVVRDHRAGTHRRVGPPQDFPNDLKSTEAGTTRLTTESPRSDDRRRNENLGAFRDEQMRLRSRLARLRRRLRLQMALEFVLEAATVLVATAAILVLLDWWFRLGPDCQDHFARAGPSRRCPVCPLPRISVAGGHRGSTISRSRWCSTGSGRELAAGSPTCFSFLINWANRRPPFHRR